MQIRKIKGLNILLVAGALLVTLAAVLPSGAEGSENSAESLTVLILDDGESGSVFTVTWADDQECSVGYNVYLDGVEGSSVSLPEGATVDDSGRIHLASVASSATHQRFSKDAAATCCTDGGSSPPE